VDTLITDVRYALRGLLKSPGVAAIAVGVLALGIGLTTLMFSIVYGVIHRPLPFEDGERILAVTRADPSRGIPAMATSVHDFLDYRERQRSFEDLAAYSNRTVSVTIGERPERFAGGYLTGNAFEIVRVQPVLGRALSEEDAQPGAPLTLLLGHRAWVEQFGSDPDVVGRTVRVDGEPATVIGVMPEGFRFPETQDVWLPARLDAFADPRGEGLRYNVFGKLREGVSREEASADLAAVASALASEYPEANAGVVAFVEPFTEGFLGRDEKNVFYVMLATVGLVLLIACANVANLLLARAAVRTREVAIRVSLGAGRARVVFQMIAESLILAATGAILGMGLARIGLDLFARAIADTNPPFWFAFELDAPILVFVLAITLLAALVSGTIPAVRASRADLNGVLKDESRGSTGLHMGRLTRGLVVAEVAMSLALLVAAGMQVRSVVALNRMALPYPADDVFTAAITLPLERFADAELRLRFWADIEEAVAALPGVRSAAVVSELPGVGTGSGPLQIEGTAYATDRDLPSGRVARVSHRFFETFEVRALQGRLLTAADASDAPPVAVVTESFARSHFPGADALGRRVRIGGLDSENPWLEIVGVVPDAGLDRPGGTFGTAVGGFYLPIAQSPVQLGSLVVRTQGSPLAITASVREAVAAADPDVPIFAVDTLRARIDDGLWFYAVFGGLFAVFGGAALFMASVGLYGVMAFSVSRRTHEMGIRMALGAQGGQVRALVLRQGMTQIALGMVLGTGLALLVARGLRGIILGAQTWDPATYAVVFTILGLTGLLASAVPAARATRVDPVTALRAD
jgi:putative ABC transport system permease protein